MKSIADPRMVPTTRARRPQKPARAQAVSDFRNANSQSFQPWVNERDDSVTIVDDIAASVTVFRELRSSWVRRLS